MVSLSPAMQMHSTAVVRHVETHWDSIAATFIFWFACMAGSSPVLTLPLRSSCNVTLAPSPTPGTLTPTIDDQSESSRRHAIVRLVLPAASNSDTQQDDDEDGRHVYLLRGNSSACEEWASALTAAISMESCDTQEDAMDTNGSESLEEAQLVMELREVLFSDVSPQISLALQATRAFYSTGGPMPCSDTVLHTPFLAHCIVGCLIIYATITRYMYQ